MKIDAPLRGLPLAEVRQRAAELEQLGVDSVWGDECQHDPFLPMPEIALGTEKLQFGTNIAIAFARAPFSMAMTAWDLQKVSGARNRLHSLLASHLGQLSKRYKTELSRTLLPIHAEQRFV